MSARDVVATELGGRAELTPYLQKADNILSALTAAGWRIVPPGGLDAETVERCAQTVDRRAAFSQEILDGTDGHNPIYWRGSKDSAEWSAAALRSLIEEPTT